jgi:chromosome segregation ATPase
MSLSLWPAQVYQFLTGWVGDAYLQYTADRRLLFTTGVTLNVRPDQHRWRPFMSLSGGQQALATLAVAFAMQAAFPSPFYFFDEVCALQHTDGVL